MGKVREISSETRAVIVVLHNEGKSEREIASKLKLSKTCVHNAITRYKETGTNQDRPRSGRPRATTSSEDNFIVVTSKRNRRLTAPEICAEVNKTRSEPVSVTTVKRRLRDAKLFGRVAVRKPLLRPQNKRKRMQWALTHRDWSEEDFKKVLWTDESKFEIFGSKRRVFVRRSAEEKMMPDCVVPTVKHGGGSIMVWGCFSSHGTGDLVRVDGIMKKEQYKEILEQNAVPSGLRLIGDGFIFQQDNDPKHSSKLCRGFLEQKETEGVLKNMVWPPQSPDLNPIELLWEELDRNIHNCCPSSKEDMWKVLQESWNNISPETINKLIARMPRLVKKVIKCKGGFFDEKSV
jgi:transposase